ncbi:hypothetical protein MRX96_003550 [Rhipicephalus microplus]
MDADAIQLPETTVSYEVHYALRESPCKTRLDSHCASYSRSGTTATHSRRDSLLQHEPAISFFVQIR